MSTPPPDPAAVGKSLPIIRNSGFFGEPTPHPPPDFREEQEYRAWGSAEYRKTCRKCGVEKEPAEFPRNPRMRDGLHSWCRSCANEATRAWRAERHVEYNTARREAYRAERPPLTCVECGETFEGRRGALVCSRRCKDARYRRLHRETYLASQRAKDARRRARSRVKGRETGIAAGSRTGRAKNDDVGAVTT